MRSFHKNKVTRIDRYVHELELLTNTLKFVFFPNPPKKTHKTFRHNVWEEIPGKTEHPYLTAYEK